MGIAVVSWRQFFQVFLLIQCLIVLVPVYAADDAVILMYHNVAENTPPSTSVTPQSFKTHMQFLADNEYTVWPLLKTLEYLASAKPIPPKTVVLTFDDAYQSVYTHALPILKQNGWPFTIFVTTQYIAEGYVNFMSWDQLREIGQYGGEVGNHSFTHAYFIRKRSAETNEQWQLRITGEISQAQSILRKELGNPIPVVAYPYGEYSKEVKDIVRELGYFGLGQHSGVASSASDFQAIPRFSMATGFDELEDFAIKVAAKNLPVTILSPTDGVVKKDTDIPVLKLQLEAGDYKKEFFACYASGQGRIKVEWVDAENSVVNITANQAIKPGRTKYNCTAPSKTESGVHYWFSFLWMKREPDGSWYLN